MEHSSTWLCLEDERESGSGGDLLETQIFRCVPGLRRAWQVKWREQCWRVGSVCHGLKRSWNRTSVSSNQLGNQALF